AAGRGNHHGHDPGRADLHPHIPARGHRTGDGPHSVRDRHGAQPVHRPVHPPGGVRALCRGRDRGDHHRKGHKAPGAPVPGHAAVHVPGNLYPSAQPLAAQDVRDVIKNKELSMKDLNRTTVGMTEKLPIKVVQFGEGNFLRAFVDYVIDMLNEKAGFNAGVVLVQPLNGGLIPTINAQEGLYTLFMRGVVKGGLIDEKRVISCVQKGIDPYSDYQEFLALAEGESLEFLISNTTEAGIAYNPDDRDYKQCPSSFPAKVTALLHKRFLHFDGAPERGLTIIPCELINHNAEALKDIVLQYAKEWDLGKGFMDWVEEHNSFHN